MSYHHTYGGCGERIAAVAGSLAGPGRAQLHLRCHPRQNFLTTYLQWDLISPLTHPPHIPTTMAPSIESAALLIVVAGIGELFEGHSTANVEHPPILQDLARDGGGNIGGRGFHGSHRSSRHFCCCRPTYVGWLSVPFLVRDLWDGLIMVLYLLCLYHITDCPRHDMCVKRGKNSTLPDIVREVLRG